jgi:hypothetical protein
MFRFAFGKLRGLLEFQAAFLAVQPKEAQHRFGMRGKIRQRFVYRGCQHAAVLILA